MKKLLLIAIGITVIVSLILPLSAMAAGNNGKKTDISWLHYDVNFVIGTPVEPYQIQVTKTGTTTINVTRGGEFAISGGQIVLKTDQAYEVWGQIRSNPGSSAMVYLDGNCGTPFSGSTRPSGWILLGNVTAITTNTSITINNTNCTNFATRWVVLPYTPAS